MNYLSRQGPVGFFFSYKGSRLCEHTFGQKTTNGGLAVLSYWYVRVNNYVVMQGWG